MRVGLERVVWASMLLLSACAIDKLALAPPAGVNFTGQWKLNTADSDDPQRVAMSQSAAEARGIQNTGNSGGGGRGRGRGGTAAGIGAGPVGPAAPAVGVLRDGLHWPGADLKIDQAGGVVTLTSGGVSQVYQPSRAHQPVNRETLDPRGDGPPPTCGWDDKTLVVDAEAPSSGEPDFEQRYSLSDDGQRLIEVVAFKGGRATGFTVSRVWDRVP